MTDERAGTWRQSVRLQSTTLRSGSGTASEASSDAEKASAKEVARAKGSQDAVCAGYVGTRSQMFYRLEHSESQPPQLASRIMRSKPC